MKAFSEMSTDEIREFCSEAIDMLFENTVELKSCILQLPNLEEEING